MAAASTCNQHRCPAGISGICNPTSNKLLINAPGILNQDYHHSSLVCSEMTTPHSFFDPTTSAYFVNISGGTEPPPLQLSADRLRSLFFSGELSRSGLKHPELLQWEVPVIPQRLRSCGMLQRTSGEILKQECGRHGGASLQCSICLF